MHKRIAALVLAVGLGLLGTGCQATITRTPSTADAARQAQAEAYMQGQADAYADAATREAWLLSHISCAAYWNATASQLASMDPTYREVCNNR